MSRNRKKTEASGNTFLGDLESIRVLLDQEGSHLENDNSDIPLLDDVIDGGLTVNESALQRRINPQAPGTEPTTGQGGGLSEDTITALLGNEWRQCADDILTAARATVHEYSANWSSQNSTELNEALRLTIEQTLGSWLAQTLSEHITEMRRELLTAIEDEMQTYLADFIHKNDAN